MLPEIGALKAGGTVLKLGAAAGKGAEIIQKAGGAAQAAKDFAALGEILSGAGAVIAGPGGRVALRDAPRLATEYGGKAGDWVKVGSSNYKAADGVSFEVHAYKNITTGKIVELKTKFQ